MATSTPKKKKSVMVELRPGEVRALMTDVPPGVDGFLSKQKIATLLTISESLLKEWIAEGRYPAPDAYFGKLPRWSYATHNRFCRGLAEAAGKE